MPDTLSQELMTTEEVARLRRMTPVALAQERYERRDTPPYLKIGRKVYYRRADVERWLADHLVTPPGAA